MKKIISLLIVLTLSIIPATASADVLSIVVDTKAVTYTDAYPFIENGRTMIPLRLVAENMNAQVEYDEKTNTITIVRDGNCKTTNRHTFDEWTYIEYKGTKYENATVKAIFQENNPEVLVELYQGKKLIHSTKTKMDAEAKIINGRTFIPARYVAYALGYGIYYDQPRNRILYTYKANQIADFESKLKYNHDYYTYTDLITFPVEAVTNYMSSSYRDGYSDIKIVDGDNGWELYKYGSRTERSYEMARLTNMPANYTFETEEYVISPDNTLKENLKIFKDMIENKTDGEVTLTDTSASLSIDTYDNLVGIYYIDGRYTIASTLYGRYDYSMFYCIDEGERFDYDGHISSRIDNQASKYKLLFLKTFTGELGERIWTMMDDYYMHKGAFYIEEACTGEGLYSYYEYKDPEINNDHATYYGFDFIKSRNRDDALGDISKVATLKYGDFEFEVEYDRTCFGFGTSGYDVYFEKLPNK